MLYRYDDVDISAILPVEATYDDCLISVKGDVTVGWELSLPASFSMLEEHYDELIENMESAVKMLPPWTVIHRQERYVYRSYVPQYNGQYIHDSYEAHFAGRQYLTHRSYIFVTLSRKENAFGPEGGKLAFYRSRPSAKFPKLDELESFSEKANLFIDTLTGKKRITARRLTEEDYRGGENSPGLLQRHFMLDDTSMEMAGYGVSGEGDRFRLKDDVVISFSVTKSRNLPNVFSSVDKVDAYSGIRGGVYLSMGSRLGQQLPCNHVVNQYILVTPQDYVIKDLEDRRKAMEGGINAAENKVSAAELSTYIDRYYSDNLTTVYSHMNVIAWDREDRVSDLHSKIASAFASMQIEYCYNTMDCLNLQVASCPGGESELGAQNYFFEELRSAVAMGCFETVDPGMGEGRLRLCDRFTNVPVTLDVQALAQNVLATLNYNIFLLGSSGSGKSFFTNLFLRNCYEGGESVFVIDIGDSYEGLCSFIYEMSGGRDGIYHTWSLEHPFSFNPFQGFSHWGEFDNNGRSFFISLLKTMWVPFNGWTAEADAVLETMISEFEKSWAGPDEPVFTDFYDFVGTVIYPQFIAGEFRCGYPVITDEIFSFSKFLTALSVFAEGNQYGFLLNNRHPADLFTSRFVVFEVDQLSSNKLLYSLCMLCMMNSFDNKIRHSDGFKVLCIDEAWQAISKEVMAEYLKSLWKTARKYSTSAMVVTQQLSDMLSSPVVKDAIVMNSSIKMLLDQSGNEGAFPQLKEMMALGDIEESQVFSINKGTRPDFVSPAVKDVFICWDNKKSGVWRVEASRKEGYIYESNKEKKRPLLEAAVRLGSIRAAVEDFDSRGVILKNK